MSKPVVVLRGLPSRSVGYALVEVPRPIAGELLVRWKSGVVAVRDYALNSGNELTVAVATRPLRSEMLYVEFLVTRLFL